MSEQFGEIEIETQSEACKQNDEILFLHKYKEESIKSSEKCYSFNPFNFKNLECTVETSPHTLGFVLALQRTATQTERALCAGLFTAMKSLTVLHGDWAA